MTNILSNTPLAVGIIVLVVWGLRKLAPNVPAKYAPYVAIVLGVLTSAIGGDLAISPQTMIDGALTGLASAGLWDASKSLHKNE